MGRIRHTALNFGLSDDGYWLRAVAFGRQEPIARVELEKLTWRELSQVLEDITENWRPGVEILGEGIQETLFD
jgi:hypothetical protein